LRRLKESVAHKALAGKPREFGGAEDVAAVLLELVQFLEGGAEVLLRRRHPELQGCCGVAR
jgi:hypothetical protein